MVGPPKVINKRVNDKLLEPYEVIVRFFMHSYNTPLVEKMRGVFTRDQ